MTSGGMDQSDSWKRQVTISPPDVYFPEKPDAEGRVMGTIDLQNRADRPMVYKIKTTNPTKFIVKPNVGQLMPESSTKI
jgi:MSP (Major sperm protein) domain